MAAFEVQVVDVDGSFARFVKRAGPTFKRHIQAAAEKSRQEIAKRMYDRAPVGPIEPHMRDYIQVQGTLVGVFDTDQAEIALFNEYRPNEQPFMRSSMEDEDSANTKRAIQACQDAEDELTVSGI